MARAAYMAAPSMRRAQSAGDLQVISSLLELIKFSEERYCFPVES
jgi:hypothetical protein